MRWLFVILNVIAAIALLMLGAMAVSAHRTHAYSTYVELKKKNVLAERPGYSVEQSLRSIADGGLYSRWIADVGAGVCLMNAFGMGIWLLSSTKAANSKQV